MSKLRTLARTGLVIAGFAALLFAIDFCADRPNSVEDTLGSEMSIAGPIAIGDAGGGFLI